MLFTSTDIISIYIFLQFMRGIPRSLDEAAILEGASHFTVYRKVVFPLLKPAIATVMIIKGVAIYNEFYIPFLYMKSKDLGVVATSLFKFKGPFDTRWEVIAAGVVIAIIPTLVVFLALQRYIYNGFTRRRRIGSITAELQRSTYNELGAAKVPTEEVQRTTRREHQVEAGRRRRRTRGAPRSGRPARPWPTIPNGPSKFHMA